MEKLDFLKTVSADDFKKAQKIDKLEILRNETTGKCFFTYGSEKGAVTAKYPAEPLANPMVSEVFSQETGKTFHLLHNCTEGGATKMEVL